jgi:hypothetical protein
MYEPVQYGRLVLMHCGLPADHGEPMHEAVGGGHGLHRIILHRTMLMTMLM